MKGKPRLKRAGLYAWVCEGIGVKAIGVTPKGAFLLWQMAFKAVQSPGWDLKKRPNLYLWNDHMMCEDRR